MLSVWLKIKSGCGILIYSALQGLIWISHLSTLKGIPLPKTDLLWKERIYGNCLKILNTLIYTFLAQILLFMHLFPKIPSGMANSVDPDHTAPSGSVWSGSKLFAYAILSDTIMYEILGIYCTTLGSRKKYTPTGSNSFLLTLVLLNPDRPCHCKQCRSRSVGFFCIVCHSDWDFKSTIWINLKIRSGCGILIESSVKSPDQ